MAKTINEVEVLRFFEEGPIEKAEVLFNIVSEKMRQRLGRNRNEGSRPKEKDTARKRQGVSTITTSPSDAPKSEPPA